MKKILILVLVLISLCAIAKATPPMFPNGEKAMYEWIDKHIKYPEEALKDSIQGTVVLMFTVTETGEIKDIRVTRGKHRSLDLQAVRLVKSMPKWIPAHDEKDNPIEATHYLPIRFKLPEQPTTKK